MEKIKILAFAPYSGLKQIMLELAARYPEIELTCIVGYMQEALELAKTIHLEDYFAIISRAGTVDLLEEISPVPVVDIGISVHDMLCVIRLAQTYQGKFAVVGYPQITGSATLLNDLLQFNVDVFTITKADEISELLETLKNKNYSLIIGDVITVNNAKQIGLDAILVTTNKENVEQAFQQCIRWRKAMDAYDTKACQLKSSLVQLDIPTLLFNESGDLIWSSFSNQDELYNTTLIQLQKYIPRVIKCKKLQIVKQMGSENYNINGALVSMEGNNIVAFFLKRMKLPACIKTDIITYKNLEDMLSVINDTFITDSYAVKKEVELMQSYSKLTQPIIIYGEAGSGVETWAYSIYKESSDTNSPFVSINTNTITDRQWNWLLKNENSPLMQCGYTIYFSDLNRLSKNRCDELYFFMHSSLVSKRNRFIFSVILNEDNAFSIEDNSLFGYLLNTLGSLKISVTPLRERIEDIPNLVTLYINQFNSALVKQVVGLQPEAMELLTQYNWPGNVNQLKGVLKELILRSKTAFISYELALEVLSNEKQTQAVSESIDDSLLQGSLEEISVKIIGAVLKEEKMNQSKAAARLKISRSTLRRRLNI